VLIFCIFSTAAETFFGAIIGAVADSACSGSFLAASLRAAFESTIGVKAGSPVSAVSLTSSTVAPASLTSFALASFSSFAFFSSSCF